MMFPKPPFNLRAKILILMSVVNFEMCEQMSGRGLAQGMSWLMQPMLYQLSTPG